MSAPSQLLASLQRGLSNNSQQMLSAAGVLPIAATDSHDLDPSLADQPVADVITPSNDVANTKSDVLPDEVLSDDEKLALFDKVLDEAEHFEMQTPVVDAATDPSQIPLAEPVIPGAAVDTVPVNAMSDASALFAAVTPQALPQATEDIWQQAQPSAPTTASQVSKERSSANWTLDGAVQESGGVLAAVETEKQPEISPEVESYLQRVEETQVSPEKELSQLIPLVAASSTPAPTEVVRVLPVTKAIAAAGHKKSPKFSVRWLVEWSDKVVKMFRGKVVYRKPATNLTPGQLSTD